MDKFYKLLPFIVFVTLLGGLFWIYQQVNLNSKEQTKVQAQNFLDYCIESGKQSCRLKAFRNILKHEPNNTTYQANYAFSLTRSEKHKEAIKIYKKLIDDGIGTFDLMAYYADSLKATGKYDEAIKWYKSSLELSPSLVDVTRSLSQTYLKVGNVDTAKKLLKDFIKKYPKAKGYIKGDLIAIDNK